MNDQEIINNLTIKIVDFIKPNKIILFGSHARGDATPESDYDLLIIAPSTQARWKRAASVYLLLAGSGVPKEIVWWTPDEINDWRNVKTHFINIVLNEGTTLYEKPA